MEQASSKIAKKTVTKPWMVVSAKPMVLTIALLGKLLSEIDTKK